MVSIRNLALGMGLAGLMLSLLLGGCSLRPGNDPKSVAETFLNHLKNTEFKKAAEYGTDSSKQLLLLMDSLKDNAPQEELAKSKGLALTITKVDQLGDTAKVEYRLGEASPQVLDMVKKDGLWKVDFKKQI